MALPFGTTIRTREIAACSVVIERGEQNTTEDMEAAGSRQAAGWQPAYTPFA